uniref:Uncharacterized protein n=1 Tax=Anopheles dirus TaxID=7168 RepID=A0A182N7I6_9DIPT
MASVALLLLLVGCLASGTFAANILYINTVASPSHFVCGLLSTQEAIWHGVPIIGFPVFADQFKNINYCVAQGGGKRLSIEHVNKEELASTIREIMTTESYRTNMKRMSALFRDQPEHPLDRAVWWIEWVLRHPDATEMMTHGVRLHWFIKYSYDVLLPLFAGIAIVCHGLFLIVRRLFCRRKSASKHSKQKTSDRDDKMASVALLLLLVGCLGSGTLAANILYINTVASPSHFGWNRALIYELAAQGHNLTVFGVDSEQNPPENVTFILLEKVYETLYSDPSMETDFFEMSKISPFSMQVLFNEYVLGVCEIALRTEGAKPVWWIEWVLRHPDATEMLTHGSRLHWFIKYSYDVLIPLFAAIALVCHGLFFIGHNLTVFGVDSEPNPPGNVTFILLEKVYETLYSDPNTEIDFFEMSKISPFSMQLLFNEYQHIVCDIALRTEGAKRLQTYPPDFGLDLIVHDYLAGPCMAALAHHRFGKPPVVAVTAYHAPSTAFSLTGSYQYSALVPYHAYDATEDMSYKQRFINLLVNMQEEFLYAYDLVPKTNRILRQYDPTIPDVTEFNSQTKLVLLNANPIIQFTEPLMPNVIPVGGLQIIEPKPLPADLTQLLEQAGPGGVVLFSLGTNVRSDTLGDARILAILGAMEALPEYTFLWKFESDKMPRALPSNVHVRKWLPQNDLLAQPAVRLFITHSGLLSTQEAIWHGVPMIGFPVFADQFMNINYCVARGVGKRLNIAHVNKEELVSTIREIMTTESYRTNMKRMSSLFRDQPDHPLDRAVWWIEWVLRHPDATEMLTHGSRLHWFIKYSYDVLIPLFAAIALVCHGLFLIVRRLFWRRKGVSKYGKQKKS